MAYLKSVEQPRPSSSLLLPLQLLLILSDPYGVVVLVLLSLLGWGGGYKKKKRNAGARRRPFRSKSGLLGMQIARTDFPRTASRVRACVCWSVRLTKRDVNPISVEGPCFVIALVITRTMVETYLTLTDFLHLL